MRKPREHGAKRPRSRALVGLGMLIVAGLAGVSSAPGSATDAPARAAIAGQISVGSGELMQVKQEGSVVTLVHPDVHELTGSLEGMVAEFGTLKLDRGTGKGSFDANAGFVGTVLGSEPGTARVTIRAQLTDSRVLSGRIVVTHGKYGLAGVQATATFRYVFGEGGSYEGFARFTKR
jgi:hypothetical protein